MAASNDVFPRRDALFLSWSSNFLAQASAFLGAVGLDSSQITAYTAANLAYANSYALVTNPATKTKTTVEQKNINKAALGGLARDLSRIVQAFPGTTNVQRIAMGLSPRGGTVSPVNPPTVPPVMEIISTTGRSIRVKLHGTGTDLRSKPAGCAGASIFSFVGATPPSLMSDWTFEGATTRTTFDVVFGASVAAGSQVWLAAFWTNPRSQAGPMCTPIEAWVGGGVAAAA